MYDVLQEMELKNAYVLQSLGLPRHRSKIYGEIDFVVVCESGVACMEIKGGHVECRQDILKPLYLYSLDCLLKGGLDKDGLSFMMRSRIFIIRSIRRGWILKEIMKDLREGKVSVGDIKFLSPKKYKNSKLSASKIAVNELKDDFLPDPNVPAFQQEEIFLKYYGLFF